MNKTKKENLERNGWRVGSVGGFLDLTPEEEAYIELKISLSSLLQEKRKNNQLTQNQLAKLIDSSQSRVAKMEKAESSVSVDLILKSLFALGAGTKEIAKTLSGIKENLNIRKNKRIAIQKKTRRPVPSPKHESR